MHAQAPGYKKQIQHSTLELAAGFGVGLGQHAAPDTNYPSFQTQKYRL